MAGSSNDRYFLQPDMKAIVSRWGSGELTAAAEEGEARRGPNDQLNEPRRSTPQYDADDDT